MVSRTGEVLVQMKVVQVKGGNGSGKTTIAKQLLELNGTAAGDIARLKWGDDNGKWRQYAMYLRNIGYILIGQYSLDKAMGGTDCYPTTVDDIKAAIRQAIDVELELAFGIYAIVFEGMMISTTSTFYHYLLELAEEYSDVEPLIVILKTTPDGCMKRIAARPSKRTKKVPKFENIASKSELVVRHAKTYDQQYVRWIDVERTPEDAMVVRFLEEIGDGELLDEVCEV